MHDYAFEVALQTLTGQQVIAYHRCQTQTEFAAVIVS